MKLNMPVKIFSFIAFLTIVAFIIGKQSIAAHTGLSMNQVTCSMNAAMVISAVGGFLAVILSGRSGSAESDGPTEIEETISSEESD